MKFKFLLLTAFLFVISCKQTKSPEEYQKITLSPQHLHTTLDKLTEVIIHDIFSPPVASRIYLYATMAAYEALTPGYPEYAKLNESFKDYTKAPLPNDNEIYSYELASIAATLNVAKELTFSIDKYVEFEKELLSKFYNSGMPTDVYDSSIAYGNKVAQHVLEYSKHDNYLQTRGLRYTVKSEEGKWVPTPPQYGDAMEPYWETIRTVVIDSASQFPPAPVIPYSKNKNSAFWKELMEVYTISETKTKEQEDMAWFWDDNAFVMNVQGHVMFANKKMTPGGHWIAIAKTAAIDQKKTFMESAEAYLLVATALHEAFICSWHVKYKTEKIRAETVINAEVDPKWVPFLQTPPFPEYTSGHSTISAAAAEALTYAFGDNVSFTDSTEFKYDHGVQTFKSFREAATQCSYSRLYGGIHYRSGVEEGQKAGIQIGQYVVNNIKTTDRK